jgi:acyl-CoA synthetase (AMP-forming)/AMP-acid ligase II
MGCPLPKEFNFIQLKGGLGVIIKDWVTNNARRYPDKIGIVSGDIRMTFKQIEERVNRLANYLLDMGLQKGDRVAFLDKNCPWYMEFYFGVTRAGMVAVPLNYRLVAQEYIYLINHSEAKLLIVGESFTQIIDSIRDKLPTVEQFIALSNVPGYKSYHDLIEDSSPRDPKLYIDENDLAIIEYTSGTTAKPKGCMITHKNLVSNAMNFLVELPLLPDDICYNPFPLFHSGGFCVMAYMSRGCTQVYEDFEIKKTFEACEKENVSFMFIPAGALIFLCDYPEYKKYNLESLKLILTGGSRTPAPVINKLFEIFPNLNAIYDTFALTEASPLVCIIPKSRQMFLEGRINESSGPECYGTHVRLVDENGLDVPVGSTGEIAVKGDNVMQGYWNMPEQTMQALNNGWLLTGDMGRFDENRHLYVVDRKKDMILSGSENIASKEVEEILYQHQAVADVAVIGLPDDKWGEVVHAEIVLKDGFELSETEIIDFCKERLASYKKPRSVRFVNELPRNPSGKILKTMIRQKYSDKTD